MPQALHTLQALLLDGHDHRLVLNQKGRNHYFCTPQVQPKLHLWGSSTASNISSEQWDDAQSIHHAMQDDAQQYGSAASNARYTSQTQQALQQVMQLPQNTPIILTESGTDAHRQWAQHLYQQYPQDTWCVIMPEACETGRSIPQALQSQQHAVCLRSFSLRDQQGKPRTRAAIKDDVQQLLQQATQQKQRILFIMVDASKTGCLAPHLDDVMAWKQTYTERMHLLVDACQARLSFASIRRYTEHGAWVAITGSKFWGAPSFCAALIMPAHHPHLPQQATASWGMLLRWQLALKTMQAYRMLHQDTCRQAMQRISQSIQQYMQASSSIQAFATDGIPRPPRESETWEQYPSIFPFFIQTPQGIMPQSQAIQVYQQLQSDALLPIQMGRPIAIQYEHEEAGLFRLCISAPLMMKEAQHKNTVTQQVPKLLLHLEQHIGRMVSAS